MYAHTHCVSWFENQYAARSQRGVWTMLTNKDRPPPPPHPIIAWEIMRVDKLYDLGASVPADVFLSVCWRTLAEQWMHFSPVGLGDTDTVFIAVHNQVTLSFGAPPFRRSLLHSWLLLICLSTETEEFYKPYLINCQERWSPWLHWSCSPPPLLIFVAWSR